MAVAEAMTAGGDWVVRAFPNAGLPEYVDGRYLFGAPLPYLVENAVRMADLGVNLIGGCCGTTPEYTRRISERLRGRKPSPRAHVSVPAQLPAATAVVDLQPVPPAGPILDRIPDHDDPSPPPSAPRQRPPVGVGLDPPRRMRFKPVLPPPPPLPHIGRGAL